MVHGSGVETGYKSKDDDHSHGNSSSKKKNFFFNLKGFGSFLLLQFLFLVYILLKTLLGWIKYSTGVNIKKKISKTR